MSYTYLREGAEAYSAECFAGIHASAPSKSNPIAAKFCSKGSATESCRSSRFGTTSGRSTANRGAERSTSSAAAFRARTFPRRTEKPSESAAKEAASGAKWPASSGKLGLNTCLPKTRRCSKAGALSASSKTSTRSAMTRGASNSALKISAKRYVKGFGVWGGVLASKMSHKMPPEVVLKDNYGTIINSAHRRFLESFGHLPPPEFAEWAMEFPIGWTGLRRLETRKFRSWRRLRLRFLKGVSIAPKSKKSTLRKPSEKPLRKAA